MTQPEKFVATVWAAGVLGLFGMTDAALSYAPATHTEMGRTAVDRSDLDAILKAQYRVDRGATFVINGETVQTWIEIGTTREDFPRAPVSQPFPQSAEAMGERGWTSGAVVCLLAAEPGSRLGRHMVMAGRAPALIRVPDPADAGGA